MAWTMEGVLDDLKSDTLDIVWGVVGDIGYFAADMLHAIPTPSFLQDLPAVVSSVPADVLYWVDPFELPYAFTVITAALLARMALSLIPWVGAAFR